MITNEDYIKKYNDYYLNDKGMWELPERDRFCYETVSQHISNPGEIIDIGCGNGHTLEFFKNKKTSAKLHGIDLSEVAISIAKRKLPDAILKIGFLEDFLAEQKFEVVMCLGSAEHFLNMPEDLKRMKNLLKDNGICYMEIPNNLSYSPGEHSFRKLSSGSHQYEWHLDKHEWENEFKKAGFYIKSFYETGNDRWGFIWVLANGTN